MEIQRTTVTGGSDLPPPAPSTAPVGKRGAKSKGPSPVGLLPPKADKQNSIQLALWKTTPCTFYEQGCCKRGSSCSFAHGVEERLARPDLSKTLVCGSWRAGRACKAGDKCAFGHGAGDLRAPVREPYLMTLRNDGPAQELVGGAVRAEGEVHAPPNSSCLRTALPMDGSEGSTYSPSTGNACSDSFASNTWAPGSSQSQSDDSNGRQAKQGRRAWADSSESQSQSDDSNGQQAKQGRRAWADLSESQSQSDDSNGRQAKQGRRAWGDLSQSQFQSDDSNGRQAKQGRRAWADLSESQSQSDDSNGRQAKQGRRAFGSESQSQSDSDGRQAKDSQQAWALSDSDGRKAMDGQQACALEGSTSDKDVSADKARAAQALVDLCRLPLRGADKFLRDKWKQKAEARAQSRATEMGNIARGSKARDTAYVGWGAAECPPPPMPTSFMEPDSPVAPASGLVRLGLAVGHESQAMAAPLATDMNDFVQRMCRLCIQMQGSTVAGFLGADARLEQPKDALQRMLQNASPDFYED